ncbi:MAG: hypothetical protein Kow00109_01480 [Acidobacteriota bacterium]
MLVPLVVFAGAVYEVRRGRADEVVALERAKNLWRAGAYEEAVAAYEVLWTRVRKSRWAPRALLEAGRICYLNLRDPARAAKLLERLVDEYPRATEAGSAHLWLAEIYSGAFQDTAAAARHWEAALEGSLAPLERLQTRFRLAEAAFNEGRFEEALAGFQRLVEDPELPGSLRCQAWLRIGTVLQLRREDEEALVTYRKILEDAACESIRVQATLALIESLEYLNRLDEAIETAANISPEEYPADKLRRLVERLKLKQAYYGQ